MHRCSTEAGTDAEDPYLRRLIQVVYRSRCLTDAAGEREILETSRRNNPAHDITGVLVCHGGWFMQVLEGPAIAINDLIGRIRVDRRNGDFLLLRATVVDDRDFANWAMGSTTVDQEHFLQILAGLMSGKPEARRLLRDFILGAGGRLRD